MKDNETLVWVADTNQPHSLTLANKRLVGLPKFVVSNSGFLYDPARKRTWIAESTHTTDKLVWYNSFLAVQDDGNIIIYDDRTGDLCWARFGFEPGRHRKKINPSLWALLKNMEVRLEPTLEPRRLTLLMRIICVV
ncbi:hypothetical protein ABQX22_12310 [Xanthomonas sp. WHRI 1810A]|uniref:hypothetical protein n=1 Tax=Xanthomonas sp. WHRI 1810A TaxID=3161565 RepID=UPI0032E8870E